MAKRIFTYFSSLLILGNVLSAQEIVPADVLGVQDSLIVAQDSLTVAKKFSYLGPVGEFDDELAVEPFLYGSKVRMALLLPFAVDTTAANKNYLNFYFGSLLAVRELSEQGVEVELNVVDVTDPVEYSDVPKVLKQSDIIIGPVSSRDISGVLDELPRNKYIISPLDARTEYLTQNNRVILASTPAHFQIEDSMDWLLEDMAGTQDSLIVVRESNYRLTPTEELIYERLDLPTLENVVEVDYTLSTGLEMNEWFGVHTHLKDTVTRVVAASEHEVFVKDVIRNVYLQNNLKKQTFIYGPAKTKSPEMIEMCDARLRSSVTYHIDYTSPKVIDFVRDFRALFQGEPDSFAFHGYDTTKYFISIFAIYGNSWVDNLEEFRQSGLQTYFRFCKPEDFDGAFNVGLRRLTYEPDYKLYIQDR